MNRPPVSGVDWLDLWRWELRAFGREMYRHIRITHDGWPRHIWRRFARLHRIRRRLDRSIKTALATVKRSAT